MVLEGVFGSVFTFLIAVVAFIIIWKIFKNLLGAIIPAIILFAVLWMFSGVAGTILSVLFVIVIFIMIWKVFKRLIAALVLSVVLFLLLYFIGWI